MNAPPANLLRLRFATHGEWLEFRRDQAAWLRQAADWADRLGDRAEPFHLEGICDLCTQGTRYAATPRPQPEGAARAFKVRWPASALCGCGLTNLDRLALRVLMDGTAREARIYQVGHFSRVARWLRGRTPNLVTSQYEAGRAPGEVADGVRYEDVTALSFAEAELDAIVCLEVLEHVPHYLPALREMARTLRPGGRAVLSFPWLGGEQYEHLIRAEMREDGTIHHILPPEYHGDPAAPGGGILSFRAFGWKVLDEMREAGFARAEAIYILGPLHGYVALVPIILGTR